MPFLRKIAIIVAVVLSTALFGFITLRLTGTLDYFVMTSGANAPAIKTGSKLFATSMKKPEKNDFICFRDFDEMSGTKAVFVFRLVAREGDKVEIKDGVLFVNDLNADKGLILQYAYMVPRSVLTEIGNMDDQIDEPFIVDDSFAAIYATEAFMRKHNIAEVKQIFSREYIDSFIVNKWHKSWNADQFGPIIVPAHSYFVMGDNRHNSMDSRYRGFIPEANYKSTVIMK